MIGDCKTKVLLWVISATFFLVLGAPPAAPILDFEMERTVTPLHRGDERLVYKLTVRNEASENPQPGDVLTCTGAPGGDPAPVVDREWLRNGEEISGESASTYTVATADEGKSIQCRVTGTNKPAGGPPDYGPVATVGISLPPVVVEPAPLSAPPSGSIRAGLESPLMAATPSGTATSDTGSAILSDVVASEGTGVFTSGSSVVEGVTMSGGGRFQSPSAVTGSCVAAGSTITKVEEPVPGSGELKVTLSKAATCSAPAGTLEAGAMPFAIGQEISGECIPVGAKVVKATDMGGGAPTVRFIEMDKAATCSKIGMVITATSTLVCEKPPEKSEEVPNGWSAGSTTTWSFQWLRNGTPIVGASAAEYTVQNEDTEPFSSLQCEATAEDADGHRVITVSPPKSTQPAPPSPYVPPSTFTTTVSFANQTTGPVKLEFEPQGGTDTPVFGVRSSTSNWECVKQLPSLVENALVICSRDDSLPPGEAFEPVEVIVAVSKDTPNPIAVKARAFGGGFADELTAEDEFSLEPAIPWGFDAFEAKAVDELGDDYTVAGGHPFAATAKLSFTDRERVEESDSFTIAPTGLVRTVETDIPPGFLGNPQAFSEDCPSIGDVIHFPGQTTCPPGSVVGGITLETTFQTFPNVPIYSIEPERGAPAEFGFGIAELTLGFALAPELRAESGYAIRLVTAPIVKSPSLFGAEVTLCGFGGKLGVRETGESMFDGCKKRDEAGANPIPFLTNPTRCEGPPPTTRIAADTWEEPRVFARAKDAAEPVVGCENVTFEPEEVSLQPTSRQADSPTGLDVSIRMPTEGLLSPTGITEGALKRAVVILPEGMSVNPASANGLGVCTSAEIGIGTNNPVRCPDSSKVATALIRTPLLEETLEGTVYLAKQGDNPFGSLLALYLVVDSPERGILVKLAGKVTPSPSGRLTTVFDNNPQFPFESIELSFPGGDHAPLINPPSCDTYQIVSELSPWSAQDPDAPTVAETVHSVSSFKVNRGPGNGPCPDGALAPTFRAGVTNPIAGAKTPFVLNLSRVDGSQRFAGLEVDLPPGLVAYLRDVPYCADSVLASIPSALGTGAAELASPACPVASQLGSVTVGAGAGSNPFYVNTGRAYLAGPYKGAPLSMAIVTPAVAGPFDLGSVVVRTALRVNPTTARITAVSDPIPTIIHGIPLDIRDIRVKVDRPDFTVAPTNCEAMSVAARVRGDRGGSASPTDSFQVAGCEKLRFGPRLRINLHGATKRGAYQRLVAILTAKPGEANIARASVTLPHSAFLAQEHIRTICTRVQFAVRQCPKGSIYGKAKAISPLLGYPLEGPVYLRSSSNPLPDLVVAFRGPDFQPIEVELAGRTDSKNGGIRNTFDLVPDAPVSKFTLELKGGRKSLIVNSRNLCAGVQRATVRLNAQNGKIHDFRPVVRNDCKAKKHGGKKRSGKRP